MKLYIIRHGETEENAQGILMGHIHGVLSSKGKEQAEKMAQKVKDYNFAKIYSSDLQRCVDTAEIIKSYHHDVPIEFTPLLRETNFGDFQGKKKSGISFDELGGNIMSRKPNKGESFEDVKNRVKRFLDSLECNVHGDVLVVTHAGVILILISIFNKLSMEEVFEKFSVNHTDVWEFQL